MALDTSLDSLTPDTRTAAKKLLKALDAQGIGYKIRSTRRTCAEQAEQYAIGRGVNDDRAVVTQARGCMSFHTLGRAIDITLLGGASYDTLGQTAESLGWKWGGRFPGFPDVGHVEWHPGMTIEQLCPDPSDCQSSVDAGMLAQAGVGGGGNALAMLAAFGAAFLVTRTVRRRQGRRRR